MMGIIIQWVGIGCSEPSPLNYHRFGTKSVIELTIDNCLKSVQAQKVIVSLPVSERKNINGSGYQKPLIDTNRTAMNKTINFQTYDSKDPLEGLYHASVVHGLSHIVRVYANCPLLPSWLLNDMISHYYLLGANSPLLNYDISGMGKLQFNKEYNKGFAVEIFPFHLLAQAYLKAEEGMDLKYILSRSGTRVHNNESLDGISNFDKELALTDIGQLPMFESLIANTELGYDIGDLLKELNDKQENAAK